MRVLVFAGLVWVLTSGCATQEPEMSGDSSIAAPELGEADGEAADGEASYENPGPGEENDPPPDHDSPVPDACRSRSDCGSAEVCVAVRPGLSECQPALSAPEAAPPAGPNGQLAPPAGMLRGVARSTGGAR